MVKLKGPGLSREASGTLANTLTFGKSKRTSTLRKKPTPKQPRSGLQISMRAMMKFLSQHWNEISTARQATWADAYTDPQLSNYNSYLRHNLERWRNYKAPSQLFPAAEALNPAASIQLTSTGGVRHVDHVARVILTANDNWTLILHHIKGGLPPAEMQYMVHIFRATDLTSQYWTHTPLEVGPHGYQLTRASADGKMQITSPDFETPTVT